MAATTPPKRIYLCPTVLRRIAEDTRRAIKTSEKALRFVNRVCPCPTCKKARGKG